MSNCMKYGGKVKKMKEGGMTKTQEAYAEGLRTGKGLPILRTIDKGLSKAVSTPKEKRMIEKGYNDMLKAKKAEKKGKTVKKAAGGMLKTPDNPGLKKLPTDVRNKMGYMKKGGKVHKMKKGGKVSSCSKRADGIAMKGKTKGKIY